MPCVVTDACGNCRACLAVCPIDCFYEDEGGERVFIRQSDCIGCLCCYLICPDEAIIPQAKLPTELMHLAEVNQSKSMNPTSRRLVSTPLMGSTPLAVQGRSAATAYGKKPDAIAVPDWWTRPPKKSKRMHHRLSSKKTGE